MMSFCHFVIQKSVDCAVVSKNAGFGPAELVMKNIIVNFQRENEGRGIGCGERVEEEEVGKEVRERQEEEAQFEDAARGAFNDLFSFRRPVGFTAFSPANLAASLAA